MFEDYKSKDSLVIAYTGDGKGKTSASIGLMARALGTGWHVSFIQFIKHWDVGEHTFIKQIQSIYDDRLDFYKGGKGFYNAGKLSAKNVSKAEHQDHARQTYDYAYKAVRSGDYGLVICDEINNAVNDGLLTVDDLRKLMTTRHDKTSLCVTGRNFPEELVDLADIATNMTKLKHHFDKKFLANEGIDF